MPRVLVACPYRRNTPALFRLGAIKLYDTLSYSDKRLVMFENEYSDGGRHYGPNALARNALIDQYLNDEDAYILWLDVDLVRVPTNLIESLLVLSRGHVAAPFVFVEKLNRAGPPSFSNGGWFYDTGGFVREGEATMIDFPYWQGYQGGKIELDSVGCCYLIPADVYRAGARYDPVGDEVEHRSLMRRAKALGYHIYATDAIKVEHAYLPHYGVKWNHKT